MIVSDPAMTLPSVSNKRKTGKTRQRRVIQIVDGCRGKKHLNRERKTAGRAGYQIQEVVLIQISRETRMLEYLTRHNTARNSVQGDRMKLLARNARYLLISMGA
jgi:hypothetical protein